MAAGEDAIQSYVDKWLAAQPAQRVALAFVDPARRPGHVALAALEQELLGAAYGIREPQVAAAKLNWWAEELSGAAETGGRHPLTHVLFDDARATRIDTALWLAPALAAIAQLEEGTAADFAAQLAAAAPLHGALAALETAWWFGATASPARAARLATLAHLLHALRRLEDDAERDRLPLPMAVLARHDLRREQLRRAGVARNAAVRDQLAELAAAWRDAARLPGPLGVFRAVEAHAGEQRVRRALAQAEPLASLQRARPSAGLTTTFAAWQAARRWRRAEAG
jgi:15-cis-phytoene synthase